MGSYIHKDEREKEPVPVYDTEEFNAKNRNAADECFVDLDKILFIPNRKRSRPKGRML